MSKTKDEVVVPKPSNEELLAEISRLKSENAALEAKSTPRKEARLAVTPKGTIRVPNIGVFGLCLYQEQWTKLFNFFEMPMPSKLTQFIEENKTQLKVKPAGHVSIFAEELKKRSEAKKASK